MHLEVIHGGEIDRALAERWFQLQRCDHRLASPFLCSHYVYSVAATRDDVFVGLMHEGDGRPVGIFPFERAGRSGRPVGGPLSDCQAVIAPPGVQYDANELIAGCGLAVWDFDHLLTFQQPLKRFHFRVDASPVLDLSKGFEAYIAQRNASGTNQIKQIQSKCRKLEREVGPVRLVVHESDEFVLRRLRRWKSRQYKQTRVVDVFSYKWTVALINRLCRVQTHGFSGVLSGLYAGDRLVAAHFGMRSHRVWHWWFPAYSPRYAAYTPGLILLLKMAQAAQQMNLDTIDLGNGRERYKRRMATGSIEIARGWVRAAGISHMVGGLHRAAKELARASGLAAVARLPEQALRSRRFHG